MGRMISQFLGHVLPGIARPLQVLWNQMIGFVFLMLAVWAVPSAIRYARQLGADPGSIFRLALSVSFAAIMAYFGIASFLRARRISRS